MDEDGHWFPIYSTGRDGIDQREWFSRKISNLKDELGYDATDVDVQHASARYNAMEAVFGKKWYLVDDKDMNSAEVLKRLEPENKRYEEWKRRLAEYEAEKTHRLDSLFMQVVTGKEKRDGFQEIGMLDDEHIKQTCKDFCCSYGSNVGMMCNCLDKLHDIGYRSVWCTCSDCGEQFQLWEDPSFSFMIDPDCYTGNGGIGVVMKRVLCRDCRSAVECPVCYELNMPNPAKAEDPEVWNYDFLACVMHAWLNVCWGCTDGFESHRLRYWDERRRSRFPTELGEAYYEMEKELVREYDLDDRELYAQLVQTRAGRAKVNKIRDLLEDAAREHFSSSLDEDWFADRLDTEDPRQMYLPGMEKEGKCKSGALQ